MLPQLVSQVFPAPAHAHASRPGTGAEQRSFHHGDPARGEKAALQQEIEDRSAEVFTVLAPETHQDTAGTDNALPPPGRQVEQRRGGDVCGRPVPAARAAYRSGTQRLPARRPPRPGTRRGPGGRALPPPPPWYGACRSRQCPTAGPSCGKAFDGRQRPRVGKQPTSVQARRRGTHARLHPCNWSGSPRCRRGRGRGEGTSPGGPSLPRHPRQARAGICGQDRLTETHLRRPGSKATARHSLPRSARPRTARRTGAAPARSPRACPRSPGPPA